MSFKACRAALMGVSMLALAACAAIPTHAVTLQIDRAAVEPAVDQTPTRESTAFTLGTDQPRTAEQLAMVFDKADLSIKVMPETKTIDAVAVLDFTATAPLAAVVVELDTLLAVSSVQVDGREIPAGEGGWSNPEGRMTIPLAEPLAAGGTVSVRIAYAGAPRVAPRAPWDGGFGGATTADGWPWIARALLTIYVI